jgi:hypothetical protein
MNGLDASNSTVGCEKSNGFIGSFVAKDSSQIWADSRHLDTSMRIGIREGDDPIDAVTFVFQLSLFQFDGSFSLKKRHPFEGVKRYLDRFLDLDHE